MSEERKTYLVEAVPEDDWWIISVPEVDGAISQVPKFDQIEMMAMITTRMRDLLALILNVPADSFDLVVQATNMRYTLTRDELLEVCVRFAETWGLIDSPGGFEWRSRIREAGGPDSFRQELEQMLSEALGDALQMPSTATVESMNKDLDQFVEQDLAIAAEQALDRARAGSEIGRHRQAAIKSLEDQEP